MTNRLTTRLVIAGVATLLIGLIIFFPARVAYSWVSPPGIKVSGIHGTVWRGHADQLLASGIHVSELQWRLKFWPLFAGAAAFSIEGRPATGFVEGNVSIGFGGAISMRDVNAALSLQSMESLLGISGLRGEAVVKLDELELVDNFPQSAVGSIEVANLQVPKIHRSPIGGYRVEFFTQDSGIAASIEDTDGIVDIAGSLQLDEGRNYLFVAQVAAKENAPASIRQQLQFLGSANERGQHEMRIEGQL